MDADAAAATDTAHDTALPPRDRGAALVITMMVMALVAALGTTVVTVTVNNLTTSRQALDAGRAVDAADAGLTQAITYLRSSGGRGLAAGGWGSETSPMSQPVVGSAIQRYQAWIAPLPVTVPTTRAYRVTSTGTAGDGRRTVSALVTLTLDLGMPLGVFGRSVQGAGTPDFHDVSIFSSGCVWKRSKITFTGTTDAAYGIPPAVHSAQVITDSTGTTENCSPTDSKRIHQVPADSCKPPGADYRWDQDSLGGPCDALRTAQPDYYGERDLDGDGDLDVRGTYLADRQALFDLFKIRDDPFPPHKIDELREVARSQGNHHTSASGWPVPNPSSTPDAVLFFDLTSTEPGAVVDLNHLGNTWNGDGCQQRSLLIVVEGGNAKLNGNTSVAASLVLTSRTYGEVDKANGTGVYEGTVFANTVNLAGTPDFSLDQCFLDNLSPSLFSVDVSDYRELDR